MKITQILLACFVALVSAQVRAAQGAAHPRSHQNQMDEVSPSPVQIYGKAETTFPIFVGAGIGINILDTMDLSVMYGLTPEPYSQVIGEAAASFGGNSAYKDVVEAAFKNNNLIRVQGNYFFESAKTGWLAGFGASYLTANGKAGVDRVLTAATGRDFLNLRQALIAAGKNPEVDIDTKMIILDVRGGYSWDITNDFIVKASVGVAKVVWNEVSLKSGLAGFESTAYGNNMMRTAESDVQSILSDNGISPTLGVELNYLF